MLAVAAAALIACSGLVACSGRAPSAGGAPPELVPAACPPWRAPPRLGIVDAVVDETTAQRLIEHRRQVEQERVLEELDPALVASSLRLEQSQIALGCVSLDAVVDVGRALFMRSWRRSDGWGHALVDTSGNASGNANSTGALLRRVQEGRFGGPDALSCQSCHWKGGALGAGDRVDDAWLAGDGDDVDSADARNPPALWGAGWVEIAAREISADLREQADGVQKLAGFDGAPVTRPLASKGISFGTASATPDGAGGATLDLSGVVGVDADLIVKPFGLKGTSATLREFIGASLQLHLGLQAEEVVSQAASARRVELGDGPTDDPDRDGVTREITEGQLSALALLIATTDAPPLAALDEGPYREPELFSNELDIVRSPEFTARWLDGFALFGRFGCASCHVPFVPVTGSRYRASDASAAASAVVVDLASDGARPIPDRDDEGRFLVAAFSDFKRHDLGPRLAGRHADGGVPAELWLTKRLWGVGLTSPYLHTGAAMTFDEAVAMHGGEAEDAARAFARADEDERVSLRLFLASLARAPSVRIR